MIFLGVDPAKVSGLCLLQDLHPPETELVKDLLSASGARLLQAVDLLLKSQSHLKITACIERPPRGLPGGPEVVFASCRWEHHLRGRWPRRLRIITPRPNQWQTILHGTLGQGKDRSLNYARAAGLETDDHNLSDAFCIASFARQDWEMSVANK